MGQYYFAVVGDGKGKVVAYDAHKFKASDKMFIGLKLMEHSWLLNPFVLAVAKKIYRNPSRVAWVGDYAEEDDMEEIAVHAGEEPKAAISVWKKSNSAVGLKETDFSMEGKFLVNHTQKLFVDIDKFANATRDKDDWVVNPLPLFTAIGNGRGGGDYRGANNKKIGAWAWDMLSVEDVAPEGYAEDAETLFYPC